MYQVCAAFDARLGTQTILNHRILADRNALLVKLAKTTLVNQLLNGGTSWETVGYIRLNQSEHAHSGLVQSNEYSVVDLAKTEELHNLLGLGRNTNYTTNTNNESKLRLGRDVEAAIGLGCSAALDRLLLGGLVFCLVFGGVLEVEGLVLLLLLLSIEIAAKAISAILA